MTSSDSATVAVAVREPGRTVDTVRQPRRPAGEPAPVGVGGHGGAIAVLVAVDIRHARSPHEVSFAEATRWSVAYVAAAIAFGVVLTLTAGTRGR